MIYKTRHEIELCAVCNVRRMPHDTVLPGGKRLMLTWCYCTYEVAVSDAVNHIEQLKLDARWRAMYPDPAQEISQNERQNPNLGDESD